LTPAQGLLADAAMIRRILIGSTLLGSLLSACSDEPPGQRDEDGAECELPSIPQSPSDQLFPDPIDGPTACPRDTPLIDQGEGPWTLLDVRDSQAGQSHCAEIGISFGPAADFCGLGSAGEVARVYFIANGPGTYSFVDDELTCLRDENGVPIGPPPGQPAFAAGAWRGELIGTGVMQIEDSYLDNNWTRGSIDVVFPDRTRLLADFLGPLCSTE
jgi:hypothetical protein